MLKEQTNWRDHWPGNADNDDRPAPVFTPMKGYTWLYVTIPLVFYIFDWSWRKVSRRQPVNVSRVVVHGPDVIELVVDRWMSHSQPGQVSSYLHSFNKNKNSSRDNQHPFFIFILFFHQHSTSSFNVQSFLVSNGIRSLSLRYFLLKIFHI